MGEQSRIENQSSIYIIQRCTFYQMRMNSSWAQKAQVEGGGEK